MVSLVPGCPGGAEGDEYYGTVVDALQDMMMIIVIMIVIIIDVLGRRVLRSPRNSGGWDFTLQSSKHL